MGTAAQFLTIARSYIGTTELPPNSNQNPFSQKLGRPAEAWCADFVVACARQAGIHLPSESAYTPTMADGFRRAGRWFHTPQPGDCAFFDVPGDNTYGIQHIEIVDQVRGIQILDVGGNTGSGDVGSQDNGGGVFGRVRPQAWVVGYGRPAFDADPPLIGPSAHIIPDTEAEMGCVISRPQGGYIAVKHDGSVFALKGAPFFGGANDPKFKLGGNIVGGAWSPTGNGYWLVAHDGAVYSFGDSAYMGGFNAETPETRGSRYAIGMAPMGKGYDVLTADPSGDGSEFDAYHYEPKAA